MTDPFSRLRHFLAELKRRKVYRVLLSEVVVTTAAVQRVGYVASPLLAESAEFYRDLAVFGFPHFLTLYRRKTLQV